MPQQAPRNAATPGNDSPLTCSRTFPATFDQARQARHFLAAALDGSPLTADATACLGELVNNSLIHSDSRLPGGAFTVRVEQRPGRLRVEVHDNGGPWRPTQPVGVGSGDSPRLSGRGLLIVAALADSWEITPTATASHRAAAFEMELRDPQLVRSAETAT